MTALAITIVVVSLAGLCGYAGYMIGREAGRLDKLKRIRFWYDRYIEIVRNLDEQEQEKQ